MKITRSLLFSSNLSKSSFGFSSITEYYSERRLLSEKLLNLIDETNTKMSTLYSNPKYITLYNCFNELSRVDNSVPEALCVKEGVDNGQVDLLASKIMLHKIEMLETFKDLGNLELKKQRFLNSPLRN